MKQFFITLNLVSVVGDVFAAVKQKQLNGSLVDLPLCALSGIIW